MIITDITELDKKRVKIYVDGEFAFVLYKGELSEYGIRNGMDISDSKYEEITLDLLPKRATKRAMALLQKRDYTESKLRSKLAEGLYDNTAIDAAIDYVKSFHYLDDDRFVRDYVAYYMESRSKKRIEQDLLQKGINKDLAQSIISEVYEQSDEDEELKQIQLLLQKKHYSDEMEYTDKQKVMAFLLRRGYEMEKVKRAMKEF